MSRGVLIKVSSSTPPQLKQKELLSNHLQWPAPHLIVKWEPWADNIKASSIPPCLLNLAPYFRFTLCYWCVFAPSSSACRFVYISCIVRYTKLMSFWLICALINFLNFSFLLDSLIPTLLVIVLLKSVSTLLLHSNKKWKGPSTILTGCSGVKICMAFF